MAKAPCKGTVWQQTISTTLTTIAQVIELDVGEQEGEVFETRTLDGGAGIGKDPTGYASQGDITGTVFYDPAGATHQFITASILTPLTVSTKNAGRITLADSGTTSVTYTAAAFGFGGLAVRMNDGLKSSFKVVVDGLIAFPTS